MTFIPTPSIELIPYPLIELTEEQKEKCLDVMHDALNLLGVARSELTMDQKIQVIAACYRHPATGDTAEELGSYADEMFGPTKSWNDDEDDDEDEPAGTA